jgi:signal transduction histidine kinase
MLRAVGHEVRSPAAAMRSTLAALLYWRDRIPPEKRDALLEEAYQQSERLLRLAEAQLIVGKLETRDFRPKPVPTSLPETFAHAVSLLHSRYGDRAAAVSSRFPADLPPACAEYPHLEQVLVNLIGNVLEHTRASSVLVTAERQDGWLSVGVRDDGPGLPPDRLERLFERGASAGGHRDRGGLGIGLYLSRLIVERSFGGRIWLERSDASGTLFRFTIPAAPEGLPAAAPHPPGPLGEPSPGGK